MQTLKQESIIVFGAGNFGTCLAQHLANIGHAVLVWDRDKKLVQSINKERYNCKYLSNIKLHPNISAVNELSELDFANSKAAVLVIPTQSIREVLGKFTKQLQSIKQIVCAAKGVEVKTGKLPIDILEEILGQNIANKAVYLSGPSFAVEVAEQLPTAVTVASYDIEAAKSVQNIFHSPFFRVYTSRDPIGLEVAGALKNVIAIASGVCDGLGYKSNSRAALITRGLSEIMRIGEILGANPLTFNGLAGVGDLFLTCTSDKSRNYAVGYRLGQGQELSVILKSVGSVAEGVATTKAAFELAHKLGVRAPIITAVYKALYEHCNISDVVRELITSSAKDELE